MRRFTPGLIALALFATAMPTLAMAQIRPSQQGQGQDEDADREARQRRDREFNQTPPTLRERPNAGPCPFVRILYDAARYVEFEGGQQSAAAVGFTGELEGVEAECVYREADPIRIDMDILFNLGRGPQADGSSHTYRYWVAVTERNSAILAKQYFDLPVSFEPGQDRTLVHEEIRGLTIPRADIATSGANFEVLIGFEVTPEMADFNRSGSRFRIRAGQPTAQ